MIPDELLAAYLDGNTSEEETRQVLQALKTDVHLQEVLNVAIQIEDEEQEPGTSVGRGILIPPRQR